MRITSMHWAPRQPLAVADSAPCTWDLMSRVPHGVTNSPDQLLPHQRMLGTPTAVVRCWTHAPGSQYPPGSINRANFEQRSSQVGVPGVLHTAPDHPPHMPPVGPCPPLTPGPCAQTTCPAPACTSYTGYAHHQHGLDAPAAAGRRRLCTLHVGPHVQPEGAPRGHQLPGPVAPASTDVRNTHCSSALLDTCTRQSVPSRVDRIGQF
jgi:hypothetical protein